MDRFQKELEALINTHSMEGASNTPDFLLAEFLVNCLRAFNLASKQKEKRSTGAFLAGMSASERDLAEYIMANVPGEYSHDADSPPNEGAGDCAVRLLAKYRTALTKIMSELGVPTGDYVVPAANAYEIARAALGPPGEGD